MGVGVEGEVGEALELIPEFGLGVFDARLALGGDDFEAVGVDVLLEVAVGVGFGGGEEAVVETAFGVDGVLGRNPVDCAFDLSTGSCAAGFTVEVGGAAEFDHLAGGVFDDFVALDDVGVF